VAEVPHATLPMTASYVDVGSHRKGPNQIMPACEVRFQLTHHVRAFWIHLAGPRSALVTSPDSVAYMFGMQVPLSHERVLVLGHFEEPHICKQIIVRL